MSKVIYFSTLKEGTNTGPGQHIKPCPKCGRLGQIHLYKEGDGMVIHKVKVEFGLASAIDKCDI